MLQACRTLSEQETGQPGRCATVPSLGVELLGNYMIVVLKCVMNEDLGCSVGVTYVDVAYQKLC
jgi:hypothetical protein